MAQIIKLPYSVTRGAHSRKPRRSKNGTPEEREAKRTPAASVCAISGATSADPVFGLIEAHREATARHGAALREQERCEQADVPKFRYDAACEAACHADIDAWRNLVSTAPQTLGGLQAWASYLNEVRETEAWMLEDHAEAIVMTMARSLGSLA